MPLIVHLAGECTRIEIVVVVHASPSTPVPKQHPDGGPDAAEFREIVEPSIVSCRWADEDMGAPPTETVAMADALLPEKMGIASSSPPGGQQVVLALILAPMLSDTPRSSKFCALAVAAIANIAQMNAVKAE